MKKRPIQKKPPGFNILLLACGSKCVWRCNLQHDATHLSHPSSPPTPHALCYLFSFWHQPYYLSIRCTVIAELLCTHNGANVVTRFANQHRETLGFSSWITSRWDYSENEMILNRIFFSMRTIWNNILPKCKSRWIMATCSDLSKQSSDGVAQ